MHRGGQQGGWTPELPRNIDLEIYGEGCDAVELDMMQLLGQGAEALCML